MNSRWTLILRIGWSARHFVYTNQSNKHFGHYPLYMCGNHHQHHQLNNTGR